MTRTLIGTWLRLLFVQASWNYDRMIGTGIALAMDPLLSRMPGGRSGERYRHAMQRAAQYFNAHPYFSGLAVGAQSRAEHDGVPGEQIDQLRRALIGPLGSLGDQIIWAGVLPASIGIALISAVQWSAIGAVLVFLAVYNAAHFYARAWALSSGWRLGMNVAAAIRTDGVRRALQAATPIAALVLGVALPLSAEWLLEAFDVEARVAVAGVAAIAVILARSVVPALGGARFGLIVAVIAGVAGWLWP